MKSEQSNRRHILYVDSGADSAGMETVANALRELGEVVVMHGLSGKTIETVHEALKTHPFDAMVSHLPAARGARCGWGGMARVIGKYSSYGPAFGLLGEIRGLSEMPILVYTGAGMENLPSIDWDASGVDRVIEKGRDPEADARRLIKSIQYEWNHPPNEPEELRIKRSDDGSFLQMETVLLQKGGLGITVIARIVKQFAGLSGYIAVIAADGTIETETPLNDMMGMLTLCACSGSRLRVRLESTEPEAEEALREAHRLFNKQYL